MGVVPGYVEDMLFADVTGAFPLSSSCNVHLERELVQYEGPTTPHKTWFDVLAECSFGLMGSGGAEVHEPPPTSTVVRIGNVVTPEELTDDDAQKEVGSNVVC